MNLDFLPNIEPEIELIFIIASGFITIVTLTVMIYCWQRHSKESTPTMPTNSGRDRCSLSANSSFKFINSSSVYFNRNKPIKRASDIGQPSSNIVTITECDYLEINTQINNIPRSRSPITYLHIPSPSPTPKFNRRTQQGLENQAFNIN